jgi:hypothetical protein
MSHPEFLGIANDARSGGIYSVRSVRNISDMLENKRKISVIFSKYPRLPKYLSKNLNLNQSCIKVLGN